MATGIKWQELAKKGAYGSISLAVVLAFILNFSGISDVQYSPDMYCAEECESYVNFTTRYWEFCFENGGDKDLIYKKVSRGRRLWINMDKIDELVTTDPTIRVDLQVPARGRGNWRDMKSGDCLKRTTKSQPLPVRLKLLGSKDITQDVKWSFIMDHALMKPIDIDPVWKGVNIIDKQVCITEHYNTTEDNITTITKQRDTIGTCAYIYINNNTVYCSNRSGRNTTCTTVQTNTTGTYRCVVGTENYTEQVNNGKFIVPKTKQKCKKSGYSLQGSEIDFLGNNYNCKRTGFTINCDNCNDGNCDGKIDSGETYATFDISSGQLQLKSSRRGSQALKRLEIESS